MQTILFGFFNQEVHFIYRQGRGKYNFILFIVSYELPGTKRKFSGQVLQSTIMQQIVVNLQLSESENNVNSFL